jgi:hypothetical protein
MIVGIIFVLAVTVVLIGNATHMAEARATLGFARNNGVAPKQALGGSPTATVTATPTCVPSWFRVESPDVGEHSNELYGVDAVSQGDIWAVGFYLSVTGTHHLRAHELTKWQKVIEGEVDRGKSGNAVLRTLTEHWDGTSWLVIPSPNFGADDNHLLSVDAVAANDVWAVGYYLNEFGIAQTLAQHWDGTQWSVVATPNSTNTQDNELLSVEAASPGDVWAVGYAIDNDGVGRTLTQHWDGTSWSIVPSPNPAEGEYGNALRDLAVISPTDIWAVGFFVNEHYASRTLTLHWDGVQWDIIPSPNVGADWNIPFSVDAAAADDVWVVGYYYNVHDFAYRGLSEHWDGIQWTPVFVPPVGDEDQRLLWVDAASSDNVWAVGAYGGYTYSSQALIEHWDGTSWNHVPGANFGPVDYNLLVGVKEVTPDNIWAVGSNRSYENYNGDPETLVEHYGDLLGSCGIEFTDLPVGSTYHDNVRYLACRGIVSGYQCGGPGELCDPQNSPYFRPNANVTRAQLAKIVSNAVGFNEDPGPPLFADVYYYSEFYAYVNRLARHGVVTGYPCGTRPGEPCIPPDNPPYFRPNSNANRGQISKIVAIAGGYTSDPTTWTFQDVMPGSTFYRWVENLAAAGVMSGYPCGGTGEPCVPPRNRPYFRPNNNATRGQTSKIVANAFFPGCSPLAAR